MSKEFWAGTTIHKTWLEKIVANWLMAKTGFRTWYGLEQAKYQYKLVELDILKTSAILAAYKTDEARRSLVAIVSLTKDDDYATQAKRIANEGLRKSK